MSKAHIGSKVYLSEKQKSKFFAIFSSFDSPLRLLCSKIFQKKFAFLKLHFHQNFSPQCCMISSSRVVKTEGRGMALKISSPLSLIPLSSSDAFIQQLRVHLAWLYIKCKGFAKKLHRKKQAFSHTDIDNLLQSANEWYRQILLKSINQRVWSQKNKGHKNFY